MAGLSDCLWVCSGFEASGVQCGRDIDWALKFEELLVVLQ